jgi:hypothetical protein
MVRQAPSRKAGAIKQVESVGAHYASLIEASISQEIEATKVSVPKHFGHPKVRESKPGLSGSNEPVLQRCNDPGSTFMRGSFPALARY